MTTLETVHKLSEDALRRWCGFLAAVHGALGTLGAHAAVYVPLTASCARRRSDLTGCGTCYHCQTEIIKRTLLISNMPMGQVDVAAQSIGDQVFDFVTRLNAGYGDDLRDDYIPMDSARYARMMTWASGAMPTEAPFPADPAPVDEGTAFLAAVSADLRQALGVPDPVDTFGFLWRELPAAPVTLAALPLQQLDAWGRAACQRTLIPADHPHPMQCARVAGHQGDCALIPDWDTIPATTYGRTR